MKKVFTVLIIGTLLLLAGCAVKSTVSTTGIPTAAPTLPTNSIDSVDANSFRVIADAYAFLQPIQQAVKAGTMTLSAGQKAALNDVITAYNTAYTLGIAYHSKVLTDATVLTAATNALSLKLTTASTQIVAPTN
jgi:hypothetical protein